MRFQKEENTQIRFEKDGIYIMNSKYQTKEKITDIENEGKQFYKAIHSEEVKETAEIKKFIKKKFVVPLKSYEKEFVRCFMYNSSAQNFYSKNGYFNRNIEMMKKI